MADIGVFLCHHLRVPLSPTAVINKVGLEVSFTPKPDATSLAGEDVFYKDRNGHKHIHIILSKACKKPASKIAEIKYSGVKKSETTRKPLLFDFFVILY